MSSGSATADAPHNPALAAQFSAMRMSSPAPAPAPAIAPALAPAPLGAGGASTAKAAAAAPRRRADKDEAQARAAEAAADAEDAAAADAARAGIQPGQAGYTAQVVANFVRDLEKYGRLYNITMDGVYVSPSNAVDPRNPGRVLHEQLRFRTDAEIGVLPIDPVEPAFATLLRIAHITRLEITEMRFSHEPISDRASIRIMRALVVSGIEHVSLNSVSMARRAWDVLGREIAASAITSLAMSELAPSVFMETLFEQLPLTKITKLRITNGALHGDMHVLSVLATALSASKLELLDLSANVIADDVAETIALVLKSLSRDYGRNVVVDMRLVDFDKKTAYRLRRAGALVDVPDEVPVELYNMVMARFNGFTALEQFSKDPAYRAQAKNGADPLPAIKAYLQDAVNKSVLAVARKIAEVGKRPAEEAPEGERLPKRRA